MITDDQMQSAHNFMLGIAHAALGIQPSRLDDEYLDAYSHEYEACEKQSAINELPF